MGFTSCTSVLKTATVETIDTSITSFSSADLEVSTKKITYFYKPTKAETREGSGNAISSAVAEALKANGNADVLVAPQYVIKKRKGKVKEVTVSGYPAFYKNFRTVECPKPCHK